MLLTLAACLTLTFNKCAGCHLERVGLFHAQIMFLRWICGSRGHVAVVRCEAPVLSAAALAHGCTSLPLTAASWRHQLEPQVSSSAPDLLERAQRPLVGVDRIHEQVPQRRDLRGASDPPPPPISSSQGFLSRSSASGTSRCAVTSQRGAALVGVSRLWEVGGAAGAAGGAVDQCCVNARSDHQVGVGWQLGKMV